MTTYGYARVSTNGQELAGQEAELTTAGCAKVYREKVSGAKTDRAELAKLIKRLEPEDLLIVTRLDRLARSTRDLLNILASIAEARAGFRSLHDKWADTTTPHGRLMLTVLGGLAEFERTNPCSNRRGQETRASPWRAFWPACCVDIASTPGSPPAARAGRSTGRCSAVVRRIAGYDIATCSCLISLPKPTCRSEQS